MKPRTAFSLILLGALLIGGFGVWYRVGSGDATGKRQASMRAAYQDSRSDVARIVRQLDSPGSLVDSAESLRNDDRDLARLQTPAQGALKSRIGLQRKQIAQIIRLIRLNAHFDTPEVTEHQVKAQIRTLEIQLAKPF